MSGAQFAGLILGVMISLMAVASDCIGDEGEVPNETEPCVESGRPPEKAVDNPAFDSADSKTRPTRERHLWADSRLWMKGPELVVQQWLGNKPDIKGKYVLIEFWATWCGPCRRSVSLLNELHRKYGDELVVIGVCEEDAEKTGKLTEEHPEIPPIEFYSAIDTQKRMKDELGVWGIPHAIILEPDGYVIWEGFPLQPEYELTDTIIERILAVGKKLKAAEEAAEEAAAANTQATTSESKQ